MSVSQCFSIRTGWDSSRKKSTAVRSSAFRTNPGTTSSHVIILRQKRDSEFEQLTRDAVAKFQGSELEQYFNHVVGGGPALYLRLNQYANQRFPHNPVFVRNLLTAYQTARNQRSRRLGSVFCASTGLKMPACATGFSSFSPLEANWNPNSAPFVTARPTLPVGKRIPRQRTSWPMPISGGRILRRARPH